MSKLCPSGHEVRPPGPLWLEESKWTGCPPADCQFCGCAELDLACYGRNYAWCTRCHRMSAPVSASACWVAMKIVREKAGNAQVWDPLTEVEVPDLSHAEGLALRALTRFDRDVPRAIEALQAWAAAACA